MFKELCRVNIQASTPSQSTQYVNKLDEKVDHTLDYRFQVAASFGTSF